MLIVIITIIIIVLLLTIIMFLLLKKIISNINIQSKNYFLIKSQMYNNLINKNEIKNETIKEIEKIITKEKTKVILSEKIPKYQDNNILKTIKKIDNKFDYNEIEIIKNFIKNNIISNDDEFRKYILIKNKINNYGLYNIIIKNNEEQRKILKSFGIKTDNFISYLKELDSNIKKNDPTIYIYVSNNKINYDYLDSKIKTLFDETIIKGIKIKYHNVMYEYSISY